MQRLSILALSSIPVVVGLALGVPTLAREYEPIGGSGDFADVDMCAGGEYMAGVRYRSGAWLDQIQIGCAKMNSDGRVGPITYKHPKRGGEGGGPGEAACTQGRVIVNMEYLMTDGNRQVRSIRFDCADINGGNREMLKIAGGNTSFGTAFPKQPCDPGEGAFGLKSRWGRHVAALGLVCVKLLAPKPKAPAPAAQASTNAGDFAGVWITTTGQNAKYRLLLKVDGNTVSGRFFHTETRYNGSLTGTVTNGVLRFTWTQPTTNTTGTGTFRVYSDGRLDGGVTWHPSGAVQPHYTSWRGTRFKGPITSSWMDPPGTGTGGGTGTPAGTGTGTGGGVADDVVPAEWADMLDVHNERRKLHCAPALKWSRAIAATAQAWADTCPTAHADQKTYGENIMRWPGSPSDRKGFEDTWYCEWQWYDFSPGKGKLELGAKKGCDPPVNGHFTQVVWKASQRLGCGKKLCADGRTYTVCRYDPRGNFNATPAVLDQEVIAANSCR